MSSSSGDQLKSAYEDLASQITDVNERDLWAVMMRELLREGGGPDGCLQYLETERTRMLQRIKESLDRLNQQNPE